MVAPSLVMVTSPTSSTSIWASAGKAGTGQHSEPLRRSRAALRAREAAERNNRMATAATERFRG